MPNFVEIARTAIYRCFLSRDVELVVRAFKMYVRPLLEHNSVIRLPNTLQDIDAIECVQRRFTKRLRGLHDYSYEARLKYLDLQSLELRRFIVDLIWCYKTVLGLVDVDVNEFFVLISYQRACV